MGWLALAGALILALAGACTAMPGGLRAGLAAQAAGMALLGAAGAVALADRQSVGSSWHEGASPALGLDPLSGLFLALLALTAVPTLIYARAYLRSPAAGALCGLFLLALTGVLVARDVTTFLAFWELMTLAPAAAMLVTRRDAQVRAAVQTYVAVTHLGGAGVWIALLALAAPGPLGAGAQTVVAVAALIGFGTKAGLVPLHTWLPHAHPVAPAPFSALMSGMLVKVALYGLIRVEFEWLGTPPRWLGFALLGAGLLSALVGVVSAIVQQDLKRLLAYSTIENVGIAVTALGASVLLLDPVWAALAFAAALLQIVNHAVFKTLLFLGAGAIERATGSVDLDHLGGLLRQLPWTGAAFGVGCLAIAGLPPLNGFASEWLTLQALAHLAFAGPVAGGVAGAVGLAGIGATAALALLCFVKVGGLVLLGESRREVPAVEVPVEMRAALAVLAALCVVLGVVPGLLIGSLAELAPGSPVVVSPAGLPAPALALVLVAATALLAWARGSRRAAPAPTWVCGQPVTPALRWTSAGFSKPLRLVLESAIRPQRALEVVRAGGLVQRVRYVRLVSSPVERLLYRPAIRAALDGAAHMRRLQTGNVRTYAAYLLALVLGLLALARMGALG
ncbi:proton-conducting transporter membrane subunit [Solirubrobacter ginsenosidimutans]|uniref:Proton-conducting transporter membrane subunit n=1 Tax=Solirubrobacter ginsenosidimutans TaxID=490573 RepID=A0A9X3MWH8_9ACTN|nr:proton-conducting transporter membrane subunit [Solirubrobacter ginsenosidimutans]MDA0163737.1 proton-conducting transporter membrane subunit [Solirubrobacter ginsenosidimutans]